MKEIFYLEERICGRCGPRKCGWDPEELWNSGVRAIVCMGDESMLEADQTKYGFEFFDGRLPGSVPPTERDEIICREVLPRAYGFVDRQLIKTDGLVLIHCFGGIDRTSFLMVYYLNQKYGVGFEEALAQVRKVRSNALTAIGWEDLARRVVG